MRVRVMWMTVYQNRAMVVARKRSVAFLVHGRTRELLVSVAPTLSAMMGTRARRMIARARAGARTQRSLLCVLIRARSRARPLLPRRMVVAHVPAPVFFVLPTNVAKRVVASRKAPTRQIIII